MTASATGTISRSGSGVGSAARPGRRRSRSLSEAGRALFAASRARRTSANDADRLRKYLAKFGLEWAQLTKA
ncbi:hypothetical protein [Sphingomonas soli]|uniref:hypothetical protein n=1 Tax=Sphingomonas soli TaxID=266127 RepID=UPI000830ABA9|nr:hypothetical protein [Sphingomonas soli]